jgi:hypothetical protein
LEEIPPRTLFELSHHAPELVLRPDVASVVRNGPRGLAWRMTARRLLGHQERVNDRMLVPRYKPVLWVLADGVPVGYAERDVSWLSRIGAQWLRHAGVSTADVLVSVLPIGPNLGYWQTVLGAREAGVSALHLGLGVGVEEVARFQPTVLAGRPMDVLRLLESGRLPSVHLVLAVGEPLDDGLRSRLEALLAPTGGVCLSAWAPPGVRALWVECTGGSATGLHTWPATEWVERTDPLSGVAAPEGAGGEVVWTSFGWSGTVFVRLRTGVFAHLELGRVCPACGRAGPRLAVAGSTPRFFAVLDRHPDVLGWQAELRTVAGMEELIVFLAALRQDRLEPMLRELDEELSVTQFVVLDRVVLEERLAAHDDARVLDLRD